MRKGGHFVGRVDYTAGDIRFTTRGNTLYAIFLGQPQGTATIASLAEGSGYCGGEVGKVTLLGDGAELKFAQDDTGLHVTFPGKLPTEHAVALKIEGLTIEGFEPDLSIRFQGGKAVLGAARAELHGPGIAKEARDQGRASIGYWDDPRAWVSWEVRIPEAGTYQVRGRFAALKQATVQVQVGKAMVTAQPPVTGDWGTFKTVGLGNIEVPEAGVHEVQLRAVRDGWAAVNVSRLEVEKAK
jgi:alpha-L-fucosidase